MSRYFNHSLFGAALLGLALTGCAREPVDYRVGLASNSYGGQGQGALASAVPVSSAAAMLPPAAGRVIQIAERRYSDGISQQIILGSDARSHGENRIEIAMRLKPLGDQVYDNLLPLQKPSDADIFGELETRFPGMQMEIVNVLLQNRYGPYGLAAGRRSNGERCIYAWQWIDDIGGPPSPRLSTLGTAILSQPLPASVRVRLCRTGVNADQLASLVDGIAIGGGGMGNRQFPVPGAPGNFGGDALTAAGGSSRFGGQAFQGYQLPLASPLAEDPPRQRVAYKKRYRNQASRNRRYDRTVRRQATPELAPPEAAYVPQASAYGQPYPAALQPQAIAPQMYNQAPAFAAPPPAYVPPQQYGAAPQSYAAPSPNYAAQPTYAPRPAGAAARSLDQSLPAAAYTGPQGAGGRPVRIIPLDGSATAPPALTGAGRLLRDPVVLGPGV